MTAFVGSFRARLRERRFWIVQLLVLGITAGHTALEATRHAGLVPDLALLPVSTYFVPVVYAALRFGVEGAVPTAVWAAVLTIPNLILWHTAAQRPGVLLQLALMIAIAYVIARRVESETAAKERAEATNARLARAQAQLEEYLRLATEAQEEERKRLARELHDDTLQTLAIVRAELEGIAAEEPVSAAARARLAAVDRTLSGVIDGVRRFSRDLRPSLLDDLGLVEAIDWLLDDLRARTGIQAELRTRGEPRRLGQADELALFRIVQEALRNVERHAGATRVRVRLDFDERVRASVVDDGRGFDATRVFDGSRSAARLGLLGMRERAKLAGAALAVRSRPASGTRVAVALEPASRALR